MWNPATMLYIELTRIGTFLIENLKVSNAITSFRFNDSALFLLKNVEAISPVMGIGGREQGGPV